MFELAKASVAYSVQRGAVPKGFHTAESSSSCAPQENYPFWLKLDDKDSSWLPPFYTFHLLLLVVSCAK